VTQIFDVTVVGSANLDRVISVPTLPGPGETVAASQVFANLGGKGLNQAVAASRAGASTAFVGYVGDDHTGSSVMRTLQDERIHASVRREGASGSAYVFVDATSENFIVTVSGANALMESLRPEDRSILEGSRVVLVQNEVPAAVRAEALRTAQQAGAVAILNAAPESVATASLLEHTDILLVNLGEAETLTDQLSLPRTLSAASGPVERATRAAHVLRSVVSCVIVTMGREGAIIGHSDTKVEHVTAYPALAKDTTAAGDTWSGAFAALLSKGRPLLEASTYASAAASLAVTRPGALVSIPHHDEVLLLLSQ
jgi:ribokinase